MIKAKEGEDLKVIKDYISEERSTTGDKEVKSREQMIANEPTQLKE